jgi:hypothetical protein
MFLSKNTSKKTKTDHKSQGNLAQLKTHLESVAKKLGVSKLAGPTCTVT